MFKLFKRTPSHSNGNMQNLRLHYLVIIPISKNATVMRPKGIIIVGDSISLKLRCPLTKCNTPADFILAVDRELRECCHAMLFGFVG
jgi:hypothetical protein